MHAVIDLTRPIELEVKPCACPRGCRFEARDLRSFDDDPSSRWHIIGRGDDEQEARVECLQQIADERAKELRP